MENNMIGANCTSQEIETSTTLFKEFCDVFTWSYEEIPRINLMIIEHEIKMYDGAKLFW